MQLCGLRLMAGDQPVDGHRWVQERRMGDREWPHLSSASHICPQPHVQGRGRQDRPLHRSHQARPVPPNPEVQEGAPSCPSPGLSPGGGSRPGGPCSGLAPTGTTYSHLLTLLGMVRAQPGPVTEKSEPLSQGNPPAPSRAAAGPLPGQRRMWPARGFLHPAHSLRPFSGLPRDR